ncbi:DUF4249 domain-containing protein [Aquirufa ecclesiirivi]|uniref:DUF4249 domain-containing protein n=1 Tax=Aquirufa ecclesiirivi TaxID=2715124 RepID=UPI0022A80E8E|nr:DUF4249 domain-containing protein [Aquirufa ecclesiirivi]MCZ2472907.1 DUF4249 domain-containing protein [Aquirufa ecclesiirivi]MDF0694633.1 DUF4249 domain-containing protein [Aquirufa ecclesiirivi]
MPTKLTSYIFLSFALVFMTWACINPIKDFAQIDSTSYMTIEADIVNDPSLCKIRLTSSANKIMSVLSLPVTKADVYIVDQAGTKTTFKEVTGVAAGTYLPPTGFAGKVGSTYQLYIKTLDGRQYQSSPEEMNPVPEIENIVTQFEVLDQYSQGDVRRAGYTVYLDFKDSPKEGDYYMWNWKHYEPISICASCGGGGTWNFRQNTCITPAVATDQILNYTCDGKCWDIMTNNDLNVFSDVLTNGQRIVGRQVARAPFDNYTPYYFRLEQRGISKNAFTFYQSLIAQVQSSGSLFDVPAETRFSVNVKSVTNPTEKILGIFNVFSVSKKIFYIDRTKGIPPGEKAFIPQVPGEMFFCPGVSPGCQDRVPCFEGPTRTKITPEGWTL